MEKKKSQAGKEKGLQGRHTWLIMSAWCGVVVKVHGWVQGSRMGGKGGMGNEGEGRREE